ncbi:MAG TPA: iron-sulfur cluster assembly scaffold protein [Ardenticatenaceae bacterium]|nr:iron-sulfur cluster assembly scaffold protein [Ardenticatenaceae bacterium]
MYNRIVQDHYSHPRNLGRLQATDGVGEASIHEPSVDWIQVSVRLEGARIAAACFRAIGCAATVAAGSAVTEWLRGRDLREAAELSAATIVEILHGLPDEKWYCAELASDAVRAAVEAANSQGS